MHAHGCFFLELIPERNGHSLTCGTRPRAHAQVRAHFPCLGPHGMRIPLAEKRISMHAITHSLTCGTRPRAHAQEIENTLACSNFCCPTLPALSIVYCMATSPAAWSTAGSHVRSHVVLFSRRGSRPLVCSRRYVWKRPPRCWRRARYPFPPPAPHCTAQTRASRSSLARVIFE